MNIDANRMAPIGYQIKFCLTPFGPSRFQRRTSKDYGDNFFPEILFALWNSKLELNLVLKLELKFTEF